MKVGDKFQTLHPNGNQVYEVKEINVSPYSGKELIIFKRSNGGTHTLSTIDVNTYIKNKRMIPMQGLFKLTGLRAGNFLTCEPLDNENIFWVNVPEMDKFKDGIPVNPKFISISEK